MVNDGDERLRLTLTGRDLTITLSHADEKRLRMWIDRMNMDEERYAGAPDPIDVDSDLDLASALTACMDSGLALDEADHGLESYPWGDVVTIEQAEEMRRRGD